MQPGQKIFLYEQNGPNRNFCTRACTCLAKQYHSLPLPEKPETRKVCIELNLEMRKKPAVARCICISVESIHLFHLHPFITMNI